MVFRSLETRIVVFFVVLLAVVQAAAFLVVSAANERIAKREVAQQLAVGERVFRRSLEQNGKQLSQAATVLAADFGFREAIATRDTGTIISVLNNHGARINATAVVLVGLDNNVLADTLHPEHAGQPFPFPELIGIAQERRQASGIVLVARQAYQLVVVPVLAPLPIAWIAMGFAIDDQLARDIQALTSLHVSFLSGSAGKGWRLDASTLPDAEKRSLVASLGQLRPGNPMSAALTLGDQQYETRTLSLHKQGDAENIAVLHQSLKAALEPFSQLRDTLLKLALASILASVVGSILIGRSVIKPINRLAAIARRIRDGDYTLAADVKQQDEIGELASSFNHMREAISAREDKILRLAYQDTLTNLPNRALFADRLDLAIKAAERAKSKVTILMLDLDRFKHVNDTLGHQIGDVVLQKVGARLQALLRKSDTIARLGGDEFAIVLPNAGVAQAQEVVTTILTALETPLAIDGQPLDVRTSIGVASYPEHGRDPHTLVRHADVAMYVAKRGNKGHAVYHPDQHQPRQDHLTLLGELRRAVEQDELTLHYQPKVDLQNGTTTHAEALLRWVHPARGLVPPLDFIPFAEQTGYIRTITRWVIRKAIQQCKQWQDAGIGIAVSVNISARDLLNPELPELVAGHLAEYALDPQQLVLEITESGFMEDPALALEILRRFDKLGVKLSIDDYGTGYSSLSYIKKLPVHELKIDQSFVRNLARDKDDATIVKSTIDLGHNMGLTVVAEGVEDQDIWNLLRRLGCDYAQGYYMSKPLAAAQLESWLAANGVFGKRTVPPVQVAAV